MCLQTYTDFNYRKESMAWTCTWPSPPPAFLFATPAMFIPGSASIMWNRGFTLYGIYVIIEYVRDKLQLLPLQV